MEQRYDIYFAGGLVEGFDEATVRDNLATLFKANESALQKLFSGKPQLVKRGLDKPGAIKYKAAMAKAGAVAVVKAHATAKPGAKPAANAPPAPSFADDDLPSSAAIKPADDKASGGSLADRVAALAGAPAEQPAAAPTSAAAAPAKAPPEPAAAVASAPGKSAAANAGEPAAAPAPSGADFSLAPTGADILAEDERAVVAQPNIDTSAIQLASLLDTPAPATGDKPPAPDTSHLSMGAVGEDIPHLESDQVLLDPDISHLSMGEVGEDIPHLEIEEALLNPDTSGISLAPEGSDVLEEQYKHHDSTQAPSTDHLALEERAP